MAKIGRIRRIGKTYRDMSTGRFISPHSKPVLQMKERGRIYGRLGAQLAGKQTRTDTGEKEYALLKLYRASKTISTMYDKKTPDVLEEKIVWLKNYAKWEAGGRVGDAPEFGSP